MSQLSVVNMSQWVTCGQLLKSDVNCHIVDASMLSYLFVKIRITTTTLSTQISGGCLIVFVGKYTK
jgi:hypothetical protein